MPFCEEHNEVYQAAECPVCKRDGEQTSTSDIPQESPIDPDVQSETDGDRPTGDSVSDRIGDATEEIDELIDDQEVSGDVVDGAQEKTVEHDRTVEIDRSTELIDESTDVTEEGTTLTDSVVKDSEIGSGSSNVAVEDSVVSDSSVGTADESTTETEFCIYCGEEFTSGTETCPSCGEPVDK